MWNYHQCYLLCTGAQYRKQMALISSPFIWWSAITCQVEKMGIMQGKGGTVVGSNLVQLPFWLSLIQRTQKTALFSSCNTASWRTTDELRDLQAWKTRSKPTDEARQPQFFTTTYSACTVAATFWLYKEGYMALELDTSTSHRVLALVYTPAMIQWSGSSFSKLFDLCYNLVTI